MGRPHKCPYCGQSTSIGKGIRHTKTMGDRCIRLCKACRRKYTPKHQQGPERADDNANAGTEIVQENCTSEEALASEATTPVDVPPAVFQPASDLVRRPGATE